MSYSIFLGAGFSKWAANLPLANELFDFRITTSAREIHKLKIVRGIKAQWDETHPEGFFTERFLSEVLSSSDTVYKALVWYIARRLLEPSVIYTRALRREERHSLGFRDSFRDGLPNDLRQGIDRAAIFLRPFVGMLLKGIVTTNYDLLVEYALGHKVFNYGERFAEVKTRTIRRAYRSIAENLSLSGQIPLAKIHGSLSRDERGYYGDGRCGIKGTALIVPPTPDKRPPENLQYEWELARNILGASTHLLVFGYGFNPYDQAVLELLKDNGKNLKRVLIIDTKPNVWAALNHLWPHAEIVYAEPPPYGREMIQLWKSQLT